MEWLSENWEKIGLIALLVQNFAKGITDMTETKKDDAIMAKISAVIGYMFLGVRSKK